MEKSPEVDELLAGLTTAMEEIHAELKKMRTSKPNPPPGTNGNGNRAAWNTFLTVLSALLIASVLGAHAIIWQMSNRLTALENTAPACMEMVRDHEARLRIIESTRFQEYEK